MINISEIESNISILEGSLLKEENEIILIQSQLDTRELETDGDDDYFDWRIRAIKAISAKERNASSIKLQLRQCRKLENKTKSEVKIQFERDKLSLAYNERKERRAIHLEISKSTSENKKERIKNHLAIVQADKERKKTVEKEKTKRHQESESIELLIAQEFKKIVKEFLGADKYIELIQLADSNVGLKKRVNNEMV